MAEPKKRVINDSIKKSTKETTKESTKDKIIKTTYDLMLETDDINTVTVRMIATRADVNVALVNYYFTSKENLFNEVINTILITSKQLFELLDDETVAPRDRLFSFIVNYQKHMLKHRKFIIYLFVTKQAFPTQMTFLRFLRSQGISKIQSCITELLKKRPRRQQQIMTKQAINEETVNKQNFNPISESAEQTAPMDIITESKFIFDHLMSIMVFPVIYNASINSAVQEMKTTLISYNQNEASIKYFLDTYFPEE